MQCLSDYAQHAQKYILRCNNTHNTENAMVHKT